MQKDGFIVATSDVYAGDWMARLGATEETLESNINLLVANHKIPEAVNMSLGKTVPIERIDVAKVNPVMKQGYRPSVEIPNMGQAGGGGCPSWGQRGDKQMKSAIGFSMGSLGTRPENHPAIREVSILASASPQTSAEVVCVITKNPLRVFPRLKVMEPRILRII